MLIAETERLILRHFHFQDVTALKVIFTDAEVMHFGEGVRSEAWIHTWLRQVIDHDYRQRGYGPYAVVEKISGQMIGYCGLFYFAELAGQSEVELGYRLARAYWAKGYATEAARAVRDYGFQSLGLKRLVAMIDPANTASLKVAKKIAMSYEKEVMLEGYSHPDHLYVTEQTN